METEITVETLDLVAETIHDEEVIAALTAMTLSEDELGCLAENVSLLWGSSGVQLWPPLEQWLELEREEILRDAELAHRRISHSDHNSQSYTMRDSVTMVLELVHAANDPSVLRDNPEGWLWGPMGPPIQGSYGSIQPEQRYQVHANQLGLKWDKRTSKRFAKHDDVTLVAILEQTMKPISDLPAVIRRARSELIEMDPFIEEGLRVADEHPKGPWPETMIEWSSKGWRTADTLRVAAETAMEAASAAGIARFFNDLEHIESNEEVGILVAAERARPGALWRRWQTLAPTEPELNSMKGSSFWYTDRNPVDFWAACMVAGLLELGRARHGSVQGIALALVNRW